jgi:putative flippase GtrA
MHIKKDAGSSFHQYIKNFAAKDLWQITKYAIVGATAGVLQVSLLYVFVDKLAMWYIHGVLYAYLISFITAFSLQKIWTFRDCSLKSVHRQSFHYTVVAIMALVLNVALMYVLVDFLHIWHMGAQTVVVGGVGVITFIMNKKFTFDKGTI